MRILFSVLFLTAAMFVAVGILDLTPRKMTSFLPAASGGDIPAPAIKVDFLNQNSQVVSIQAEVAKNRGEQQRGLMNRKELSALAGMFFIFPDEQKRSFWMKKTLIPLDIIFLDQNKRIIGIIEGAQPCSESFCPSLFSSAPSQYVIEVIGGFCEQHNITENTKVVW